MAAISQRGSRWRRWLLLMAVLSGGVGVWIWRTHWWPQVPIAQVSRNGKPVVVARLYQDKNGGFLLRLPADNINWLYRIEPQKRQITFTYSGNYIFLPFGVAVLHLDQYGVNLGDFIKTEMHPNVVLTSHTFAFTTTFATRQPQRIEVAW